MVLPLERATQSRDPLADALQKELARESRETYIKDWRAFARWGKAVAGDPQVAPNLSTPMEFYRAMKAGPGCQAPLESNPSWWEEMTLARRCVAFIGKAVYQLVAALGAIEGRGLSPERLRHWALKTLAADLRQPMEQAQALTRHKSVATTGGYFDRGGELQAKATASLGSLVTA